MTLPDLTALNINELNALSDKLDEERLVIQGQKRQVAVAKRELAELEQAAYYGLTPDQYREAKATARDTSTPLGKVLGKARRGRALQVARAGAADIGTAVVSPNG